MSMAHWNDQSKLHERTSKNEANTSMYHWTINQIIWKDIKEWSQRARWGPWTINRNAWKEHKKMKPIIELPIGRSIEIHGRTSKNEANTSMYLPLNNQSNYMKGHQRMKPFRADRPLGPSIEMHERTSKNEANNRIVPLDRQSKYMKEHQRMNWLHSLIFFQVIEVFLESILGCVLFCSINTMKTVQKY